MSQGPGQNDNPRPRNIRERAKRLFSGPQKVAHRIYVLGYRGYERTFDHLHEAFPTTFRAPVGELLKDARPHLTLFRLRDGAPAVEITSPAESTRIINFFMRNLGLRHVFYGVEDQGPWQLGVQPFPILIREAGEMPYRGIDLPKGNDFVGYVTSRMPFTVNIVQRQAARSLINALGTDRARQFLRMTLWESNQIVSAEFKRGETQYRLQCQTNYVLWYGYKRNWDLNLIIIHQGREEEFHPTRALAAMTLVYHRRQTADRDREIWGLYTNSLQYYYFHMSTEGQYSAEYYANGEVRMFQGIRMLLQIYAQGYQLARGLKEPSTKPKEPTELEIARTPETVHEPVALVFRDEYHADLG
ncbi:hypothetical protein G4B11_009736 [Aspergillus flavus]|uniref:Uncharacterized protein n=1 Tax=Aspergillus flavus TaxID=5059 RepID=A0AB74CFT6_ASPFL|nr:hypothetical protein G4B11_009736 [Aspergillus flavus]RMZ45259.1 hypothetical protein CA14_007009 [Aspergillus flavus]